MAAWFCAQFSDVTAPRVLRKTSYTIVPHRGSTSASDGSVAVLGWSRREEEVLLAALGVR